MNLRVRAENGTHTLTNIAESTSVSALKAQISEVTGIPASEQSLATGFPPKQLEESKGDIKEAGVRNGDAIVVKHAGVQARGGKQLVRKEMPADNSCLFKAVAFSMGMGKERGNELREVVAKRILSETDRWSALVLEREPQEYAQMISKQNTWGGAIELAILAEHFQREIAAYDIQTKRVDIYCEGQGFPERALIIYDGIHYDALAIMDGGREKGLVATGTEEAKRIEQQARELVAEAHARKQFTDTNNFTLRCTTCQTGLVGEKEAREHAMQTGHANFSEN